MSEHPAVDNSAENDLEFTNTPNMLTLARILSVPGVVALLWMREFRYDVLAGVLFSLAAITDYFDGYYARKLNIEIDGEKYHRNWDGELLKRDQLRNKRLIEIGWEVRRFWVYEIRDNLGHCLDQIKSWMDKV
ncbi:MAG: DUF559 domain-containing protein [Proteobacteria bacterium]|nr:MAG: DUF559 domain-containing protein [Pseudomonadota bacterium]